MSTDGRPGDAVRRLRHIVRSRLSEHVANRRETVRRYRERLDGVPGITLTWDDAAVALGSHFAFPVLLANLTGPEGEVLGLELEPELVEFGRSRYPFEGVPMSSRCARCNELAGRPQLC